jgi:hypothetical protein
VAIHSSQVVEATGKNQKTMISECIKPDTKKYERRRVVILNGIITRERW